MTERAVEHSVLYVVPTLGERRDYLRQTLDSLLTQDYPKVGVVLVAPVEATWVRDFAVERGVDFVAQQGRGISSAINQGWSAYGAGHAFWAWLGDDDALPPESARHATAALRRHPNASMVYGRCLYVDRAGRPLFEARPGIFASRLLRFGPNLVPQPGSVARATAARSVGLLDERLRYAMDLDFFLRLKDVGPLRYVPVRLGWFRWHEQSTTVASLDESAAEAHRVRARTWTGARNVGRFIQPAATLAGRVLFRLQRRRGVT